MRFPISSCFGPRGGRNHNGIDIAAPKGTTVYSASEGKVLLAHYVADFGNTVLVEYKDYNLLYAHLSKFLVKKGDILKKGSAIGKVGSTGRSTGPHLHFETRLNNTPLNPILLTYGLDKSSRNCKNSPKLHLAGGRTSFLSKEKNLSFVPTLGTPNSAQGLYGIGITYFNRSNSLIGIGFGGYDSYPFIDSQLGSIKQKNYSVKYGKYFNLSRLKVQLNLAITYISSETKEGINPSKRKVQKPILTRKSNYWSANPQVGFYYIGSNSFTFQLEYGRYISLSEDYEKEYNARLFSHGDKSPDAKPPKDTFLIGFGYSL